MSREQLKRLKALNWPPFIVWPAPPADTCVGCRCSKEGGANHEPDDAWHRPGQEQLQHRRPRHEWVGDRATRDGVIAFAAKLPPCTMAMEACCGAPHMGRTLAALGHEIRLMSPE